MSGEGMTMDEFLSSLGSSAEAEDPVTELVDKLKAAAADAPEHEYCLHNSPNAMALTAYVSAIMSEIPLLVKVGIVEELSDIMKVCYATGKAEGQGRL